MIISSCVACAGRSAHPIEQYQVGDEQLTCTQILHEILDNQTEILNMIPGENKDLRNITLGVAGAFFIVPWFFMDFSESQRIEVQAYQMRNRWLRILAARKSCDNMPAEIRFQPK